MKTENIIKNIGLLPDVKNSNLFSISLTEYHLKDEIGGKIDVVIGNYEKNVLEGRIDTTGDRVFEILIQSPKEFSFRGVDQSKLKRRSIGKEKVFTDYKPPLDFFTKDTENIFSWIKNEYVYSLKGNEKSLKIIMESKNIKAKDIKFLKFFDTFPVQVDGWEHVFFNFTPEITRIIYTKPGEGKDIILDIAEKISEEPEREKKITLKGKKCEVYERSGMYYIQTRNKKGILLRVSCKKKEVKKNKEIMEKILLASLNKMK